MGPENGKNGKEFLETDAMASWRINGVQRISLENSKTGKNSGKSEGVVWKNLP